MTEEIQFYGQNRITSRWKFGCYSNSDVIFGFCLNVGTKGDQILRYLFSDSNHDRCHHNGVQERDDFAGLVNERNTKMTQQLTDFGGDAYYLVFLFELK